MRYPATRPPLRRMMAIDQALRAERWPNTKTFADEFEVNRRTIQRDLDYMRFELRAPIKFSRARQGFCYTERSYRLPYFQLSEGELVAVLLAERMMRQFRGTPFETDLRQAIEKLATMLPDGVSVHLDNIADFLSVLPATQIDYDANTFHILTAATVCRRRLELRYWSASRNETTRRLFDPYEMSLVDDGWYALGHCHLRGAIRTFALQRVRSARETGATFDRPADFRAENYLRNSFRVMSGDGDHRVVLRFKPEAARRFAEKKWHATQVLEQQADGSLIARLHLSGFVEVKRWVMWWGTDCEVLEPPELREMVKHEVRDMLRREEASEANGANQKHTGRTSGRGKNGQPSRRRRRSSPS
jgi:predicted DNA-binding transcriptional regulator YafY